MMKDQANKLREMSSGIAPESREDESAKTYSNNTKIYSIVSGKGGVGKTNFAINLSIKLQQAGKKVLILDADIGMSNANILLGISAPSNLEDVIKGNIDFEDIIVRGPEGVSLVSGGTDLFLIESMSDDEQVDIVKSLEAIGEYDTIIIDNGAGINKHSLTFSSFADEVILVSTPEPTALTDAYRILKASNLYNVNSKVNVVINQISETRQGYESFNKLKSTCDRFLDLELESLGFIFNDIRVNRSIMEQNPLVIAHPKALASKNIGDIADKILGVRVKASGLDGVRELGNRLIKFFG